MNNSLKIIGKIKDVFGIKGEVYVISFSKDYFWTKNLKAFYLGPLPERDKNPNKGNQIDHLSAEVQNLLKQYQEYPVLKIRPHKDGVVISSNQIPDRTAAEKLKGLGFAIEGEHTVSKKGERLTLSELNGFVIVDDSTKLELGRIIGFSSNSAQDLLQVSDGTREFYIPFVEAFVIAIDYKGQKIYVDLPEGLIEVQQK